VRQGERHPSSPISGLELKGLVEPFPRAGADWRGEGHERGQGGRHGAAGKKARIARRGLMLVLSSPWAAGKTSFSRLLLDDPAVELSISAGPRGRSGRARSRASIIISSTPGASTPWSATANFLDGPRCSAIATARRRAGRRRARGGARRAVRHRLAGHPAGAREGARRSVSVFVLPPSASELERRLHTRRAGFRRLDRAACQGGRRDEPLAEYDNVNRHRTPTTPSAELRAILRAERLKVGAADRAVGVRCGGGRASCRGARRSRTCFDAWTVN